MRILFVHERFGAFGGAEANILLAATELKRRGHTLGLLHGPGTGKSEDTWKALFEYRFPFDEKCAATCAQTALENFNSDLAYIHKTADLELLEALADSGVPCVRMAHDHDLYCMRSYKYFYPTRKPCTRGLSPYCIFPCGAVLARNRGGLLPVRWNSYGDKKKEIAINKRFQRMIVYSDYQRDELLRNGFDRARIEVQVCVRPPARATKRSSFSDRNLILFAGQIIRGKGVDVLLEALARIQAPFECAVLGDGSHRHKCERLAARLKLNDRVRFHGYVSPENSEEFYLNASVFVVSSVWPEPFGMAGPEAMHYGLPVVAFDAGGIREWLIDDYNGFLIRWMDCDTMAARIEFLLNNKARARQMGEEAFQFVNRQYDLNRYARRLEEIFALAIVEHQLSQVLAPVSKAAALQGHRRQPVAAPVLSTLETNTADLEISAAQERITP